MPNQPTSSDRKPQDTDTRDRDIEEGSARNEEKRDRDTDTQRSKDRDDRQTTDRDRGEGALGRDSKSYSREARDRGDDEKGDRRRGDGDGGGRSARDSERDTGARGNAAAPNPVQIQKYLGGLDYPVDKEDLLDKARAQGADERVMEALERIPEGSYESPVAVSREVSRLE